MDLEGVGDPLGVSANVLIAMRRQDMSVCRRLCLGSYVVVMISPYQVMDEIAGAGAGLHFGSLEVYLWVDRTIGAAQ
jgi:hypothetical protein